MQPKISVVIPTFNAASSLQAAFDSVRKQAYAPLEVVVVDGQSSDDTLDIIARNGSLVSQWVSESDDGIYDAINKGVSRATGDLIVVLGSDDVFPDNTLSAVANAWAAGPVDIIAGRALMFDANGKGTLRIDEAFDAGALLSGIPFCHNAMFATRAAYLRVGLYDTAYRICADANWVHRAVRAGCTCRYIEQVLVNFALTGESSTRGDVTLRETYRSIAENFPFVSLDEAEHVFRTVRGWSHGEHLSVILSKHGDAAQFQQAVALALLTRARNLVGERNALVAQMQNLSSSPLRRIRNRIARLAAFNREKRV